MGIERLILLLWFIASIGHGQTSDYDAYFPSVEGKYKSYFFLVVDKSKHLAQLMLWTKDSEHSKVVREFPIALGKSQGDKLQQGDLKTPEGIYFTRMHKDGKYLPEKYGPVAVPLDYPNPMDQLNGQTGSGIWLHGVGPNRKVENKNITRGCVAFKDEHAAVISKWLAPTSVAVMITPNGLVDQKDSAEVYALTRAWLELKKLKDTQLLSNLLHEDFKNDLLTSAKTKKQLGHDYLLNNSHVDIRTLIHDKYAVSIISLPGSGSQKPSMRKVLYWKKDKSQQRYQLAAERWDKFALRPMVFSQAELDKLLR